MLDKDERENTFFGISNNNINQNEKDFFSPFLVNAWNTYL